MPLETIDGFTALAIGPEVARPSEYMAAIWGTKDRTGPMFDGAEQSQFVMDLLARHWNTIAPEDRDVLVETLPAAIITLRLFWMTYEETPSPARSLKVGRNEPCPCGSGRKYKKCCGASNGPYRCHGPAGLEMFLLDIFHR